LFQGRSSFTIASLTVWSPEKVLTKAARLDSAHRSFGDFHFLEVRQGVCSTQHLPRSCDATQDCVSLFGWQRRDSLLHVLEKALETARKGPGFHDSDKLFTAFLECLSSPLPRASDIPAVPLPSVGAQLVSEK